MILVVGQIPTRRRRPGGVPGARLRAGVPLAHEVGRAGRRRRAAPRARRAGLPSGDVGASGAGGARGAGGHARRARRGRRRVAVRCPRRRAPASTSSRSSAGCSRRPSGRSRSSVGSRGRVARANVSSSGSGRARSRLLPHGAVRTTSTTSRSATQATSGSDRTRRSRRGSDEADALLVVGARLGDIETAGFTTIPPPGTGRTLIHVHPDPDELGRVYEPTLGIVASGPRFAEALRPGRAVLA